MTENDRVQKQAQGLISHLDKLHVYGVVSEKRRDELQRQVQNIEEEIQTLYVEARNND
jgi:argininosuccinate lyase